LHRKRTIGRVKLARKKAARPKKKKGPVRKKTAQKKRISRIRRPVVRKGVVSPKQETAPKEPQAADLKRKEGRAEAAPHRAAPKRQLLLCPGPVNTTAHVKNALGGPDLCHREPEFSDLLQTTRAKLVHALGLGERYTAVLIGGSGTAALEAAILAAVEPNKKLLVVNNGVYGSRIAQIARLHGLGLVEIRSPLMERPNLDRVAAALKRETKISCVAMVHHETSTGILNPVEAVGVLARKFRKRFLVDAISSLGAQKLELGRYRIGLCVGSAGKALHGSPGLSFVLLSQEEATRIMKLKGSCLYLDLGLQLRSQENAEPPFTPPVPLIAALNAALDELAKEGLAGRIAHYKERAILLRTGFKKLGLELIVPEKDLSNSLTALRLPGKTPYATLHNALKKAGFVIYAGQSELKGKIFRVAHMGGVASGDLKDFLKSLEQVLSR